MSKYVGWGDSKVLQTVFKDKETVYSQQLKEILTTREYESVLRSTTDAFYTSPKVIKEIYNFLEDSGFKGGKVLEPSCGVGRFFSLMPKEMMLKSDIMGVELDVISSKIAKYLYPSINIKNTGFENVRIENNSLDLVIGNVPFGDFKVYDTEYTNNTYSIHDYFINKCMDKLRDGGLMCIITSTYSMDKLDDKFRQEISSKANLLGAVRLPSNSFGETQTQADLLIFQKGHQIDNDFKNNFVNTEKIQAFVLDAWGYYYSNEKVIEQIEKAYKNSEINAFVASNSSSFVRDGRFDNIVNILNYNPTLDNLLKLNIRLGDNVYSSDLYDRNRNNYGYGAINFGAINQYYKTHQDNFLIGETTAVYNRFGIQVIQNKTNDFISILHNRLNTIDCNYTEVENNIIKDNNNENVYADTELNGYYEKENI